MLSAKKTLVGTNALGVGVHFLRNAHTVLRHWRRMLCLTAMLRSKQHPLLQKWSLHTTIMKDQTVCPRVPCHACMNILRDKRRLAFAHIYTPTSEHGILAAMSEVTCPLLHLLHLETPVLTPEFTNIHVSTCFSIIGSAASSPNTLV